MDFVLLRATMFYLFIYLFIYLFLIFCVNWKCHHYRIKMGWKQHFMFLVV